MKRGVLVAVLVLVFAGGSEAANPVNAYSAGTYTATTHNGDDVEIYVLGGGPYYAEVSSSGSIYVRNTSYAGEGYFCHHTSGILSGTDVHHYYADEYHSDVNTQGACTSFGVGSNYFHTSQQYTAASNTYFTSRAYLYQYSYLDHCDPYQSITLTVTLHTDAPYQANGTTSCIDYVDKYIKIGSSYYYIETDNTTADDYYEFDVFDGKDYRLIFSDGAYYDFTCIGDEVYNYNACICVYGYTCNIDSISLWRYNGSSWVYQDVASLWKGYDTYEMQIEAGYNYRLNFSDGHQHFFTCRGSDVRYDWDRCEWVFPPSPYQPPEIIQPILGYDNNIVFMRDGHGNFIKNSQIAVYNKANHTYTQKWTDTQEPYVLLAANNDSDDEVIVMCKTFDGIFTLETTDPAFGTDENTTWANWTIPLMYNLDIRPLDQSNAPLHDVFVSMYEYTPLEPLSFYGYDTYWGYMSITNCSGFSRCDIIAERGGYADYNITGLNWTSKSAMVKNYKHDIVMVKE